MPVWFIALCKSIDFVVYWAMVVPIAIAQYNRRWLTGGLRTLHLIPLFLLVMYCCAQVAIVLWRYSLPINHLNTIGETLLYVKVYHDEFTDEKLKKRVRIAGWCFLIFALIDSFWLEGFNQINSFTNLAESILVILLALIYFELYVLRRHQTAAHNKPLFVASIGIILYLAGTVVLHLTTNHLIAVNDEFHTRVMYLVSSALLLLLVLLFSRAFWLARTSHSDRVLPAL